MTTCNQVFYTKYYLISFLVAFVFSQNVQAKVIYSNHLKGKEVEIGNMLEWSTASEWNSQLFVIEKSSNGVEFVDIGTIDAAGNSGVEESYRYLDFEKRTEVAYYRLKAVDLDGSTSYSQTVKIKKTIPNDFMVVAMTNTTTNRLFTVTMECWTEGEINYQLVNYRGELIFESDQFLAQGLNELQINLEHENEGIYKLKMSMNDEVETLVIRKMERAATKRNVASKN